MNHVTCKHKPAGYLIVQQSDKIAKGESQQPRVGRYFGVDRLPAFFPPEPEIRKDIGLLPIEDGRLRTAMDKWFRIFEASTPFIVDRQDANGLIQAVRDFGYDLELLYCELAWTDEEQSRLNSYPEAIPEHSSDLTTYGYDVSWPSCNHSAIIQPGVVPVSPHWIAKLNEWGLLSTYDDAYSLRLEYLRIYPYPPFDIFHVHAVQNG